MSKQVAHGAVCGHGVAFFDRGENIEMTFDVGDERFWIEPRQAEIPEAGCILVQQHHLPFNMLVHGRGSHGAVKLDVHADECTEVAPADRILEADEGGFHRSDLLRLRALRAERGAIALEYDARLKDVL